MAPKERECLWRHTLKYSAGDDVSPLRPNLKVIEGRKLCVLYLQCFCELIMVSTFKKLKNKTAGTLCARGRKQKNVIFVVRREALTRVN